MRIFITVCMVALAFGHPVKENQAGHVAISKNDKPIANERVINKRSILADGNLIEREGHENTHEDIIQKRDVEVQSDHAHSIKKREAMNSEGNVQTDCSQVSGENRQACLEQVAANGHVIQKRDAQNTPGASQNDTQNVDGVAHQDDNQQVAYSNEGGIAKQGDGGQYIYASDFGGPMVQILQHVYKTGCCSCGCECDCSKEIEQASSPASG